MKRLSSLFAAVFALVGATLLAGCGPGFGNLGQALRNPLGYGVCGLVWLVFGVMALLDLLKSNRDGTEKLLWGLAIFFLPFVGVIAYYLFGKKG